MLMFRLLGWWQTRRGIASCKKQRLRVDEKIINDLIVNSFEYLIRETVIDDLRFGEMKTEKVKVLSVAHKKTKIKQTQWTRTILGNRDILFSKYE